MFHCRSAAERADLNLTEFGHTLQFLLQNLLQRILYNNSGSGTYMYDVLQSGTYMYSVLHMYIHLVHIYMYDVLHM